MISSRSLNDLNPIVRRMAEGHIAACKAEDIDLLVTCTYRDTEEQNRLYAQGRSVKGSKVTNAKGGQSLHNYRLAYDVVPMRFGKPVWGTKGENNTLWQRIGAIGQAHGLEWAGSWTSFPEFPHFQYTGEHPLSFFQDGGTL